MTKRRAHAVGYGNEASSKLTGDANPRRHPIAVASDIARFGLRPELDLRVVSERVGQLRIEGEPPDSQPRLIAVMFGKGHCYRLVPGKPELDSVEGRRTAFEDGALEAELAQGRPSTG